MNAAEFSPQFDRLARHFRLPDQTERGDMLVELFQQLSHYHIDAIEAGVTKTIGDARDSFWPAIGLLRDNIQARIDKYDKTTGVCQTCGGNRWVDGWPFWSATGIVILPVRRCPDCGVPEPAAKSHNGRPLTAIEERQWRDGTLQQVQIPNNKPTQPIRSIRPPMTPLKEVARALPLPAPSEVAS